MHLAIHTLAAVVCALSAAAHPLPPPGYSDLIDTDVLNGFHPPNVDPHSWYPAGADGGSSKDPPRRRDSPLSDLFPEKDGFIETGGPLRRDGDAVSWRVSDVGKNGDPLRRRDSPLHHLPDEGVIKIAELETRVADPHA